MDLYFNARVILDPLFLRKNIFRSMKVKVWWTGQEQEEYEVVGQFPDY
jgi:hypothetical protein